MTNYNLEQLGETVYIDCPLCGGNTNEGECWACDNTGKVEDEVYLCQHCEKPVLRSNTTWTFDRYNIPFQKVCYDCFEEVDAQIKEWEFDPLYAGELLEEDY
jgi:NAD-dependent SIR2 family protein deacetylase